MGAVLAASTLSPRSANPGPAMSPLDAGAHACSPAGGPTTGRNGVAGSCSAMFARGAVVCPLRGPLSAVHPRKLARFCPRAGSMGRRLGAASCPPNTRQTKHDHPSRAHLLGVRASYRWVRRALRGLRRGSVLGVRVPHQAPGLRFPVPAVRRDALRKLRRPHDATQGRDAPGASGSLLLTVRPRHVNARTTEHHPDRACPE